MKSVIAIAKNTFKEAVRNRILYLILFFALIMIGFSALVGELTIAAEMKIILDLGFAAINLFGVAICIFVGGSLVYNELEKKTIYTIVSKPIERWQFLVGKYFGLLLTIYVNMIIMAVFFLFLIHYFTLAPESETWLGAVFTSMGRAVVNLVAWGNYEYTSFVMPVIGLIALEMAIITSFAILFSSFSTPTLSMFFTALVFAAGRSNEDIMLFAQNQASKAAAAGVDPGGAYWFARVAGLITPNLGVFRRSVEQAVHQGTVDIWWESTVYGLVYPVGILLLAVMIFQRRNFK